VSPPRAAHRALARELLASGAPIRRRVAGWQIFCKIPKAFWKKIYYNKDFILRLHDPSAATGGVRVTHGRGNLGSYMYFYFPSFEKARVM